MMRGRILKGVGGFYEVYTGESGIWMCQPKGIFRKEKVRPLVGDRVNIEMLDEEGRTGVITEILPRTNELIRPASSNIDQAMVIFAMAQPRPSIALIDRFLIMMERQHIPTVVCFNKVDLGKEEDRKLLTDTYRGAGYPVLEVCAARGEGIDQIRGMLDHRTTVIAGPSGVGKSTITNQLQPDIYMETGEISRKLKRGRHTTRHAQLIPVGEDTCVMDTPGFSALELPDMEKEELKSCFPEFAPYEGTCRFQGCAHLAEPGCRITEAVSGGRISALRYEDYKVCYEELREREKRRY